MYKFVLILSLAALFSVSACSRQQSDWEKTRASNTTDAYELFQKKYPSGEFTSQAQARLKELYEERDWQKARDTDSVDAYQSFLKQHPEGKWSEEARIRIENFTLAAAPSNGSPLNPPGSPPSAEAATPPAVAASPPPKSAAGKYAIQLGAFKSGEAAANQRWSKLSGKYSKILGGLSPQVSPRQGSTGIYYRLRVVDLSDKRARSICQDLKAQRQACEVLPPAPLASHHRA